MVVRGNPCPICLGEYREAIEHKGGAPDRVLVEDKHILTTVVMYVVSVIFILAFFE